MIIKIKRELLKLLWKIIPKIIKIEMNNRKFKIPIQHGLDHRIMRNNREKWMDDLIKWIYQHTDGAFIDVGANAGQTLLKVKSLMPQLTYFGFEPNTYCTGYINEIIQVNRLENCTILPIGLGDQDAIVPLFCHNRADPTATVVENFRGTDPRLWPQMVLIRDAGKVLDSLHVQTIAVVKIDVEGYEAAVLAGLQEILRQQRPFVICEVLPTHHPGHPSYAFRMQSRQVCEDILQDIAYTMFLVNDRQGLEACRQISDRSTNYVFAPKERENVLQEHATAARSPR